MAAEMSRGHAVESWPVTPDPEVGIPSPLTRKWESRHLRPGSRTHFCLFSAQGLTIKLKLEPVRPQAVGHLRLVRCRFLGRTHLIPRFLRVALRGPVDYTQRNRLVVTATAFLKMALNS